MDTARLAPRWLNCSPQRFKKIVESSSSAYQVYKELEYKGNASLAAIEARALALLDFGIVVSTSHLKNNPGINHGLDAMTHDETRTSRTNATHLRMHLINSGRQEICEGCGIGTQWNGKRLQLDIDHIDGNPKNNTLKNLRFLCANCHKQEDTSSQNAYAAWVNYHNNKIS